jgi:hypothetical protein
LRGDALKSTFLLTVPAYVYDTYVKKRVEEVGGKLLNNSPTYIDGGKKTFHLEGPPSMILVLQGGFKVTPNPDSEQEA